MLCSQDSSQHRSYSETSPPFWREDLTSSLKPQVEQPRGTGAHLSQCRAAQDPVSSYGIRTHTTLKEKEVFLVEHVASAVPERSSQSDHPTRSKQQLQPQISNLPLKPVPAKGVGVLLEPGTLSIQLMGCHTHLSELCTDS